MYNRTSHQKHDKKSITSNDSSSTTTTMKSMWNRLFHHFDDNRQLSSWSNESNDFYGDLEVVGQSTASRTRQQIRRRRMNIAEECYGQIIGAGELSSSSSSSSATSWSSSSQQKQQQQQQQMLVPPFSPTYCKTNEFPYSNFYVKLPNGKWMVRYRSGHRDILGTDEFEGYMI